MPSTPAKRPELMDDGESRDRRYWERHAKDYDRSMKILGRPMPRMLQLVAEAVSGCESVLEVAAGTGIVTAAIAKGARKVVATDYAAPMVALLERRVRDRQLANVECRQADLYALPFERASFDAVVAANVLHLVPDLDAALAALRAVLRPAGRLIAPTFCHDETLLAATLSRVAGLAGFPSHRRFTAKSLGAAIERAGFSLVTTETIPGLFPIGYVEARSAT